MERRDGELGFGGWNRFPRRSGTDPVYDNRGLLRNHIKEHRQNNIRGAVIDLIQTART